MTLSVTFPDYNTEADEQNRAVIYSLKNWIERDSFKCLLERFGFRKTGTSFEEYLEEVHDFVNSHYDYYDNSRQFGRRIKEAEPLWMRENEKLIDDLCNKFQARDPSHLAEMLTSSERRFVFDDSFLINYRAELSELITSIGLPGDDELIAYGRNHISESDWLVILGGASATNEIRTKLAVELYTGQQLCVAGLSAERISNTREKSIHGIEYTDIVTEYDSMKRNIEIQFGVDLSLEEDNEAFENNVSAYGSDLSKWPPNVLNRTWRHNSSGRFHVLSSPSSDPEKRRANTLDTMDCFLDKCVSAPANIMLVSSSRYAPYTVFSFWKHYRVERRREDINFFYTGNIGTIKDREMLSSYLLEVRNGFNAGYDLYKAMLREHLIKMK